MRRLLLPALLLFSGCAAAQDAPDFGWLEGRWMSEPGRQVVEESWTSAEGYLLLGTNRTFVEGEVRAFEFLRIAYNDAGEGEYCAQPGGGAATCFALVESGEGLAIFENPDHDFPQRIRYQRAGDTMTATISDMSGEQSFSVEWTRQ